jgi:UBX domain-containing protein 7
MVHYLLHYTMYTGSSAREIIPSTPKLRMSTWRCLRRLKLEAEAKDQWMMLNVQDTSNFQSLQLNADLWRDNLMQDVVRGSFQFAQRTLPSNDAMQLKESYHLYVLPAILIIDPTTGQKMHEWTGVPEKDRFMEDLLPFLDTPPSDPKAGTHPQLLRL